MNNPGTELGKRIQGALRSGAEKIGWWGWDLRKEAIARFSALSTTEPETIPAIHEYGTGSTVILSDLPKGTILRERYTDDQTPDKPAYSYWYVGELNAQKTSMRMVEMIRSPHIRAVGREIPTEGKKRAEYEIGKDGILLDRIFRSSGQGAVNTLYLHRKTTEMDILSFGSGGGNQEKRKKQTLTTLELARETVGADS